MCPVPFIYCIVNDPKKCEESFVYGSFFPILKLTLYNTVGNMGPFFFFYYGNRANFPTHYLLLI